MKNKINTMDAKLSSIRLINIPILMLLITFTINCRANLNGTYYIDAINGSDWSSGKTEQDAWKSFNNVNRTVLSAGTKILLKKGCKWNQRLEIRGSGTIQNWISVGSYGSSENKPGISLMNDPDNIAILICDLDKTTGVARQQNISFIEIKDIEISNTRLGIYYRCITGTENTGFRVSNVTFNNINCDPVMMAINTATDKNTEIGLQLAAVKGNLETIHSKSDGGVREYIFPAAIFIGGQTFGNQTVTGNHTTVLTELEVSDCEFNEAIAGVMSVFYWPFISGGGANVWRQLIHKVKLSNCTATGIVNGLIGIDGINGGAIAGADGVMHPDPNGWGLLKNVRVLRGSSFPGRTYPNGTTGVILSNCQNLLFDSCEFSNVLNQGNPDGCGFDFETNNNQITIQNSKFFDNDGHSILLMNGGNFGGNTNLVIQKNIFAGNVKSSNSIYELLLAQQYDGSGVHQNVKIRNNVVFMRKKNKDYKDIGFYEIYKRGYVTATDNDLYYLEPTASQIDISFLGQLYSFNSQISSVAIPVVSVISVNENTSDTARYNIQIYTEINNSFATYYMASENSDFSGASWNTYNSIIDFTFSHAPARNTVYFKVINAAGESPTISANFELSTRLKNLNAFNLNSSFVKVFPNPASSIINIQFVNSITVKEEIFPQKNSFELTLLNLTGEILEQSLFSGNFSRVDLSRYPVGIFILRIKDAETVYSKAIIKN